MCRPADLENRTKILKQVDNNGEMKYTIPIKLPYVEKLTYFLLKANLTYIGNDTFDGSIDIIKTIYTIVSKIEEIVNNSLQDTLDLLNNKVVVKYVENQEPEVPKNRKSARSIDQINKDTGVIIQTYPSIAAAGRALGCSGEAVGIGLRNKSICQGFIWKYTGISHEDESTSQAVIKINCNTGQQLKFDTITEAAKDANLSPPGLKNRILTKLHVNDFHWIFDKTATHFNQL
jgi:hypothetical protein